MTCRAEHTIVSCFHRSPKTNSEHGDSHCAFKICSRIAGDPGQPPQRGAVAGDPGVARSGPFSLLLNGIIEVCAFPPIRQEEGEWMGHGAFVVGLAPVHFGGNSRKASKDAQDDRLCLL